MRREALKNIMTRENINDMNGRVGQSEMAMGGLRQGHRKKNHQQN